MKKEISVFLENEKSTSELGLKLSERLAAGLFAKGIRQGDHVGIYLMNGPEFLESFFAIVKIGAVPFNINYRYGYEELLYLLSNANAKAIIYDIQFYEHINKLNEIHLSYCHYCCRFCCPTPSL